MELLPFSYVKLESAIKKFPYRYNNEEHGMLERERETNRKGERAKYQNINNIGNL